MNLRSVLSGLLLTNLAMATEQKVAKAYSFLEQIKAPADISVEGYGSNIDWLFNYISIMDTFYFILVCIGLFGFSYLYSHKRNKKPYYTYGNKPNQS